MFCKNELMIVKANEKEAEKSTENHKVEKSL